MCCKKITGAFLFLLLSLSVAAQTKTKVKVSFRDSIDNAIDISEFLKKDYGFLPFAMPITEPAVGYGGLLGALHFFPKKEKGKRPDFIAGAAGMTSNKTWLAGVAYFGYWKNDQIRYRGVAGYGDINLNFYVFNDRFPVELNLNTFVFLQQVNYRIAQSHFFVGGIYTYSRLDIPFFTDSEHIDPYNYITQNSGVTLLAEYDNLNSFFSPDEGLRVQVNYQQNFDFLGSTTNWGKINFFLFYYLKATENWTTAFRVEANKATGDAPFYALPFIYLRGVPAMRYQGEFITLAETEQYYNFTKRWSVLAFGGIGYTYITYNEFTTDDTAWNAGAGFRYLIARQQKIKVGMDIARGPEDWGFYVVVGSSWLK